MTPRATDSPLRGLSKGVDHVTVPILDMDRAEHFYVDALGAELLERFDAEMFSKHRPERVAELTDRHSPLHLSVRFGAGPRIDLFLQDYGQPATEQPHPHIAFEVEGADLDRVKTHLQSAGIPVDGPRRLGPPGQASLYVMDPFGNKLEFMTHAYPGQVLVGAPDWKALTHEWRG